MQDANTSSAGLPFRKMHGAGNDFVVIDARGRADAMTPALARAIGDRHRGVGFDQLATIHEDRQAAARLVFWNADGTRAGACGNATRCIADLLMRESGARDLALRTERGLLHAARRADGTVEVDMGAALLGWREVPLAREVDTVRLPLPGEPSAVGMGNPHCVHFVADLAAVDLAAEGARVEHDPLFPERTNVQFVEVISPRELQALVWERGVGPTLASGSSACAIGVAAHRRGLTGRAVQVHLPGGTLDIRWREEDGHVLMSGPVAHVFEGRLAPDFLASVAEARA